MVTIAVVRGWCRGSCAGARTSTPRPPASWPRPWRPRTPSSRPRRPRTTTRLPRRRSTRRPGARRAERRRRARRSRRRARRDRIARTPRRCPPSRRAPVAPRKRRGASACPGGVACGGRRGEHRARAGDERSHRVASSVARARGRASGRKSRIDEHVPRVSSTSLPTHTRTSDWAPYISRFEEVYDCLCATERRFLLRGREIQCDRIVISSRASLSSRRDVTPASTRATERADQRAPCTPRRRRVRPRRRAVRPPRRRRPPARARARSRRSRGRERSPARDLRRAPSRVRRDARGIRGRVRRGREDQPDEQGGRSARVGLSLRPAA